MARQEPSRELQALAAVIRRLRLSKGLTQEGLSLEVGAHRNYVGRIERHELSPTLEPLFEIARCLEVEADELLRLCRVELA